MSYGAENSMPFVRSRAVTAAPVFGYCRQVQFLCRATNKIEVQE